MAKVNYSFEAYKALVKLAVANKEHTCINCQWFNTQQKNIEAWGRCTFPIDYSVYPPWLKKVFIEGGRALSPIEHTKCTCFQEKNESAHTISQRTLVV
jgi:hypothetical protein